MPTRSIAGRRVAYSSDNKDLCLISVLVPRTALSATPRKDSKVCGEESTHETAYSGIQPVA